jgi:hypothetical protein
VAKLLREHHLRTESCGQQSCRAIEISYSEISGIHDRINLYLYVFIVLLSFHNTAGRNKSLKFFTDRRRTLQKKPPSYCFILNINLWNGCCLSFSKCNLETPMKKTHILAIAAATGFLLGSIVQAGNLPNSARTLTSGIGTGTTASRIPSSHPYSSRSRGYASSGHSRSSYANSSLTNFAKGSSHRPDNSYRSGASGSSDSRPVSPEQATGHVPTSIGGIAGNRGVTNPPPTSIPANLPGQAAGHAPGSIGGPGISGTAGMTGAVSNPPPASIPATITGQAAGHVPANIGVTAMGNLPPSSIPADIPVQAAGHVPGAIGGRH